jgi:hypothetical protein
MLESADTIEKLSASLAEQLKARGLEGQYADQVAKALVADCVTIQETTPPPGTLAFLVGPYAIRKDDNKLFDLLSDGLKAVASGNLSTSHQWVDIGVAVAKLVRGFLKRGCILDRDSVHVLTILKGSTESSNERGLSADEVLRVIQRTQPERDIGWVREILEYLKDVPTRDGGTSMLASPNSDGRWRCHV